MKKIIYFFAISILVFQSCSPSNDSVDSTEKTVEQQILGKWKVVEGGIVNQSKVVESQPFTENYVITFQQGGIFILEENGISSRGSYYIRYNTINILWIEDGVEGVTTYEIFELTDTYFAWISEGGPSAGDYEYIRLKRVN